MHFAATKGKDLSYHLGMDQRRHGSRERSRLGLWVNCAEGLSVGAEIYCPVSAGPSPLACHSSASWNPSVSESDDCLSIGRYIPKQTLCQHLICAMGSTNTFSESFIGEDDRIDQSNECVELGRVKKIKVHILPLEQSKMVWTSSS